MSLIILFSTIVRFLYTTLKITTRITWFYSFAIFSMLYFFQRSYLTINPAEDTAGFVIQMNHDENIHEAINLMNGW